MTRYINDFSISRELAERPGVDTRDNPRVKEPGGAHDESRRMLHLRARGFAPLASSRSSSLFDRVIHALGRFRFGRSRSRSLSENSLADAGLDRIHYCA